MTLYDRIRKRRIELGITQLELAEMTGYTSRSAIAKIESGDRDIIRAKVLDFAKALKVSPSWLMGWEETEPAYAIPSRDYPFVPYGISAGVPVTIDAIEQLPKMNVPDCFLGKYAKNKNIILITVNGESMNKIMPNGSVAAVLTNIDMSSLKNEDIVLFSIDGDFSVKQFFETPDVIIFRPLSTDLSFRELVISKKDENSVQVHGKVVMYSLVLD